MTDLAKQTTKLLNVIFREPPMAITRGGGGKKD